MSDNDTISLKEYFNTRLTEQESQFNIKIAALEKATTIAAAQMEKRLEGQNEFRGQLKDQVATFVTKNDHDSINERLFSDIKSLQEAKSQYIGRSEHDNMLSKFDDDIKVLRIQNSLCITKSEHDTLHTKLNEDIRTLRESKALLEGKASQQSVIISYVLIAISIVISIIALFHGVPVPVVTP